MRTASSGVFSPSYADASSVWAALVREGGIKVSRWDKPLVKAVREDLDLPPGAIGPALHAAGTSVEDLVVAVIDGSAAFSMMMAETLALMERHNAKSAEQVLRIEFDFVHGRSAGVDLEHFRETHRTISRVRSLVRTGYTAHQRSEAWNLAQEVATSPRAGLIDPWIETYEDGRWPESAPPRPSSTGDEALDEALALMCDIAAAEVLFLSGRSADRRALWSQLPEDLDPEVHKRVVDDTDRFSGTLVAGAHRAATLARTRDLEREWRVAVLQLAAEIRTAPATVEVEAAVDELLDMLRLPTWKHRHDLFALWTGVRAVNVLSVHDPVLNVPDGVLRIPFKPRLFATAGPVDLWTECKTELRGAWGEKRDNNVQPDLVLAKACDAEIDRPDPADVVLVLEAKQHWKAKQREWGYALADYGKAFPGAHVAVLSHARARTQTAYTARGISAPALAFLADHRDRLMAVSEVAPGAPGAEELARLVVGAVDEARSRPEVSIEGEAGGAPVRLVARRDEVVIDGCTFASGAPGGTEPVWRMVAYRPVGADRCSWTLPPGRSELWLEAGAGEGLRQNVSVSIDFGVGAGHTVHCSVVAGEPLLLMIRDPTSNSIELPSRRLGPLAGNGVLESLYGE